MKSLGESASLVATTSFEAEGKTEYSFRSASTSSNARVTSGCELIAWIAIAMRPPTLTTHLLMAQTNHGEEGWQVRVLSHSGFVSLVGWQREACPSQAAVW
jgi:hypothetical protein